jgi:hypothetical protein
MAVNCCQLCKKRKAIKSSHVIPAFVFRAIKSDSPTGYFRSPNVPNLRFQDGDKLPLLCGECERRFGNAERSFVNQIFKTFHTTDQDRFAYGPWLHYFMTSLAWRTLILDLPGFESDASVPESLVDSLKQAARTMRGYLLGANNLASTLRNHAFVFTAAYSASAELASAGPKVLIRRSAFGYTLVQKTHGYAAVIHNLAGFLCFLIVKGNPRDVWRNTKLRPNGGEIKQLQHVSSWIMGDVMQFVVESREKKRDRLSDAQRQKTVDAMKHNPNARGLRFLTSDQQLVIDDEQEPSRS